MGDSRSWAADHEGEISVCKHGGKSKYFDDCMCDGCVSDRSVDKYRQSITKKITDNFSQFLSTLKIEQLEEMVKKI